MQTEQTTLESRLESLEFENAALRQKIAVHIKEHARLRSKNERTAKQIRLLIKQMKETM